MVYHKITLKKHFFGEPLEAQIPENEYKDLLRQAVAVIKDAIQRSQARALHAVNKEVLSLNYGIGRYISENSRKGFWGTGALAQISNQLQKEMPGLRGYSETNLKDMRTFYEEWSAVMNRQPMADDLQDDNLPERHDHLLGRRQQITFAAKYCACDARYTF